MDGPLELTSETALDPDSLQGRAGTGEPSTLTPALVQACKATLDQAAASTVVVASASLSADVRRRGMAGA